MAATTDHPSFPQPSDSSVMVWRYMDLAKLVDLLSRSELYLTQLAALEDPWEGKYPKGFSEAMKASWRDAAKAHNSPALSEQCPTEWTVDFVRASMYVNCWCMQEHESEALWQVFAGRTGVAIRSSYRVLAEGLPPDVFLGQVRYIDPTSTSFPDRNVFTLPMHKRHFYRHEWECRIVKWEATTTPIGPPRGDVVWVKCPKGCHVPIDITKTIQAVVVSPLAAQWYHDCVRAVVDRFQPGLRVEQSAMRA
jgi:hypothetical protein